MSNSNCTFSFKFETQEKLSKLIQNLNSNKTTQQYEKNNEISSYILYPNFNNFVCSKVFSNYLKKADITPVFKRHDYFLKNNYRPVSIQPKYLKNRRLFPPTLFQNCSVYIEKDLMRNTAR